MNEHYEFVNTPLPYDYDALNPYIDTKTMHLHHDKHLQTYVDNLNNALKPYPQLWQLSLEQLIKKAVFLPKELQTAVINNAGGVFNHQFYFEGMTSPCNSKPIGRLAVELGDMYGSLNAFKEEFKKVALSVFGSGYAWLVSEKCGKLSMITTANQNTPIALGLCPILCIDVWEHAYYLKHYNVRKDYVSDWFEVVNWERANEKLMNIQSKQD